MRALRGDVTTTRRRDPREAAFARLFGRLHLAYLLALPVLGLVELHRVGRFGVGLATGWLGTVVYALVAFQGYRLPAATPRALFVALAVPGQLGVLTWFTDGDLLAFLYEAAVVEVGVLLGGLAVAMMLARPTGLFGALVVLALAASWIPYALPLVRALPDWPLAAQALFVSSTASAFMTLTRDVLAAARRYNETGREQTLLLEVGADGAGFRGELVRPIEGTARDVRVLLALAASLLAVTVAYAALAP